MGESLYFLAGVTSSGKSELALKWAEIHDAEILSCDSIAVYRGMDLVRPSPRRGKERVPTTDLIWLRCRMGTVSGTSVMLKKWCGVLSKGKNLLWSAGAVFICSLFRAVVDEVVVSDETRAKVEALYEKKEFRGCWQLRQLNADEPLGLDELNPQRLLRALALP